MASLSFARIMYGTSEDLHAAHGMSTPGLSSLAANPVLQNSAKAGAGTEPATLGKLLHKAWAAFTGKHGTA